MYRVGYKIYSKGPLAGEGSFLYGGRWSSAGTRMAYTSTSLPLAMLEFLAHVNVEDFDPLTPPELMYVTATVDDRDVLDVVGLGLRLPTDWNHVPAPEEVAVIGDAWIAGRRSVALTVPSVHLPEAVPDRNVLLNPLHERFSAVTWTVDQLQYDRRILEARAVAQRAKGRA